MPFVVIQYGINFYEYSGSDVVVVIGDGFERFKPNKFYPHGITRLALYHIVQSLDIILKSIASFDNIFHIFVKISI